MMVRSGKQPETMEASPPVQMRELIPSSPRRFQRLRFCKAGSPSVKTVIDLTDDDDNIDAGCSYSKVPKNNCVVETRGIMARRGSRPAVVCRKPKATMQVKGVISDLGTESDILEFLVCMGSNVLHNITYGKPKKTSDVQPVGLECNPDNMDQCEERNAAYGPDGHTDAIKDGWDGLKETEKKGDHCDSGWELSNQDTHCSGWGSANETDAIKGGSDDLKETEKKADRRDNGWGSANEDFTPIIEILSDPWGDELKKKSPSTTGWDFPSEEQGKLTTQEKAKASPWTAANEAETTGIACDMTNQESDLNHLASGMQIDVAKKDSDKAGWDDNEDEINSGFEEGGWGSSTHASKVMQKGTPGIAEVDINPDEDKRRSGRYAPSGANLVPLGERKIRGREEAAGQIHGDQDMFQSSQDHSNAKSGNVSFSNNVYDAEKVLDESVCGLKSTKEDDSGWASVPGPSKDNQNTVLDSTASPKQSRYEIQPWGEIKKFVYKIRRILHLSGYKAGDRLGPKDQEEVLTIITHHPNKDSKIGCGVDYIMIDTHPDHQVECFFIVRTDGTKSDISYRKCIKGLIQAEYPAHEKEILEYFRFV